MTPSIQQLTAFSHTSLEDILKIIDANAQGICFIVNENQQLLGVITDGDIRRAFLQNYNLQTRAEQVMNTDFTSKDINTPKEELLALLNHRIRHIPLVNEQKQVVDYACIHRYNRFPISEPELSGNELEYVSNCIKTNWISSAGKYVKTFEQQVAAYCEMPYALAVSNGTVALHLAMEALGIGAGDEVIVPNLTFAASINSILYCGATPVLVDIEKDTWNICPNAAAAAITSRTKAIMPVHLYGLCADMQAINALAKKHQLLVIEDAAEAIGSIYQGRKVGSMSDAATFSFYGNKTITTGEGGMILFKEEEVYNKAAILRDHGMNKSKRYWHDYVGYNYRLTNLQAAIGVAQMERIEEIVAKKISIGNLYTQHLADCEAFQLPVCPQESVHTYWLYTLLIKSSSRINRDELIQKLKQNGIETRPVFYPLHEMPPYQKYAKGLSFPHSENVSKNGLCLPSYLSLSDKEVAFICKVLKETIAVNEMIA